METKQRVDIVNNKDPQQHTKKISVVQVVEEFFPELREEKNKQEKSQILELLKNSQLKLSPRQLRSILEDTKLAAQKEKKSYVVVLQKIIKGIRENNDIKQNNILQAQKFQNERKNKEKEQTALEKKQTTLEKKQTTLDKKQTTLDKKQTTLEKQQTTLEKQQTTLEKKQTILEKEKKENRNKNILKEEMIRRETIKAAKESYQNLSPDLKQHSPEEINTKINALSPNTKARLKKSGLSLSDYAQFSLAREKITSLDTKTPEGETFLTTLKKMEKSLGIVEKTDGGYPLSNEPRKETFEQNPQLMEFAKNDESLKGLEKVNVLDDKLNIKQQQKIFQLFWDADQKRFFEQILPLLERKKKADLDHSEPWFSAEEIAALQQYQVHFDWLKKKFTDKNVNYLKAAAAQAPLVAILRYLDQDSLGKQTLADLMQKEGGEYATIEQHQDLLSWAEDKIMKIKWTIKGKPISIYYNLSDPNATLQCDDYLYTDPNTGQLSLWATGKRTDLNIKMPTADTIADQLGKECSTEAFWEMIDAADTPHEYNEKLSLLVSSSIDNFFVSSAEEPRISERIARDAEKNVWVQLFTSGLIPAEISAQLNTGGELNTNPELRNLFRCLDKTSESLTTDQLKRLIASIEKLTQTLNSPDEIKKIADPVLRDSLTQLYQATKEKKSDLKARSSAMLSFFNLFTRQDLRSPSLDPTSSDFKLNISDLSATLHHLSSGLPLDQNGQLSSFSQDFRNNYEAQKSSQSEHSTADIEADLELAYG